MAFADRNGIPPQVMKAQVAQESNFSPNAFRYEPLSYDYRQFHPSGALRVAPGEAPWTLAEGDSECKKEQVPAGANLGSNLSGPDVVPRQKYGIFTSSGSPICRVMAVPSPFVGRQIGSDPFISMENVLYANDACISGFCPDYANINHGSFVSFTDFQLVHPPFGAQTLIASSYGLHQLMYDTAFKMGYQSNGIGLPPHLLFDPFTSLDLGSRYLALKYTLENGAEDLDFTDVTSFLFEFGPALRMFNGAPELDFDEIFAKCANKPYLPAPQNTSAEEKAFDYPCLILQRVPAYSPKPLIFDPAPVPTPTPGGNAS